MKQKQTKSLQDRMIEQYETKFRIELPRRTYTILRLDGRAFHTFTRKMTKPYCQELKDNLDKVALALCKEIPGVQLAYLQSDEMSFLITDFDSDQTEMWFGGNIQKIVSVSASLAASIFAKYYPDQNPCFDARVFTISDPVEVKNYFIYRQQDATRNSIQMLAQNLYSHKQLQGKNNNDLQELIYQKGKNWNDVDTYFKRGRTIRRTLTSNEWIIDNDIPIFTQEDYLELFIPLMRTWEKTECDTE